MRIGVVTPAFNAAGTLGPTIASVLAQDHDDWRMVVVDDGSSDGTAAVAEATADRRVLLVRQSNQGVAAARNRGLASVDAAAFLFLDADDELAPGALDRLNETLLACPWAIAAVGPYRFATRPHRSGIPPRGDLLEPLLRRNRFVNGGHVLVRAEAISAAGRFDPTLQYGEDWEFWIRLATTGTFAATQGRAPVLLVRRRPDGAYARLAADPASFDPCMAAIFGNPMLLARFGCDHLATLRRAATAENAWIVGREMIRHGRASEGLRWLRRSVRLHPTPRRAALLQAARMLLMLPPTLRGALRPYGPTRLPTKT
jgi:glycosyltransferase involved in cell wall biosynthesis